MAQVRKCPFKEVKLPMLLKPLEMPMECHRLGNAILKPRQPPQALFTMDIKQTIAPFSRRFSVKTPVTVARVRTP